VRIRRADGSLEEAPVAGTYELGPHDVLIVEGSGAGGYGNPRTRPAELVLADVRAGRVSVGAAAEHYGVVIGDQLEIDEPATVASRGEGR
jgi:N-methylhydantoinase B